MSDADQYDITGVMPADTALLSELRYDDDPAENCRLRPDCSRVTSRPLRLLPVLAKNVRTVKGWAVSILEPPGPPFSRRSYTSNVNSCAVFLPTKDLYSIIHKRSKLPVLIRY